MPTTGSLLPASNINLEMKVLDQQEKGTVEFI